MRSSKFFQKRMRKWHFLMLVLTTYLLIFLAAKDKASMAVESFMSIITKVLPILVLVFVIMALTNIFISPTATKKHLGESSGTKGILIAIVSGIISSGPIYMWYPLLKELRQKGMRMSLMATFFYARSIKIPLIPILIAYFGIDFTVILVSLTIVFSVINGMMTEKIVYALEKSARRKKK